MAYGTLAKVEIPALHNPAQVRGADDKARLVKSGAFRGPDPTFASEMLLRALSPDGGFSTMAFRSACAIAWSRGPSPSSHGPYGGHGEREH